MKKMIIIMLAGFALLVTSINVFAATELITKDLNADQIGSNMVVTDISNNGRYIVYQKSYGYDTIYLFDKETNSVISLPDIGNGGIVSDDGRYVAYTKFVESYIDDNEAEVIVTQVCVYDLLTEEVELIPGAILKDFSGDGRYVLSDGGGLYDRVAQAPTPMVIHGDDMTNDGRYSVEPAPDGGYFTIVRYTRLDNSIIYGTMVSWMGYQSTSVSISEDGQKVVFANRSSSVVSGDSNGKSDVFILDMTSKKRITMGYNGEEANGDSLYAKISGDGKYIVFTSKASNLVPDDTNGKQDVFLYNIQTEQIERINIKYDGTQADQDCNRDIFMNFDGSIIGYTTKAQLSQDDSDSDNDLYYLNRSFNTSIILDGTKGKNDWYVSDVNVSFQTSDPDNVTETVYSYDQNTWYKYNGQFTINKEDENDIYFYSKRNDGYIETIKQYTIKIDKTAPEISFNTHDGSLLELKNGESFPFRIKVTDGVSGIPAGNDVIWGTEITSSNGEKILRIRAENDAGLETIKDLQFIWSTP